jgi:hypothetical protein
MERSLSKLVVRRKLSRILKAVFRDHPLSPTITKGFEAWADTYSNKNERELIEAFALAYLFDTERRLKLIREKLKSDVFRKRN